MKTSPSAKGVLVFALVSFLPCVSGCLSLRIKHNRPGPSLIVVLLRVDIWSDRTPLSYGHRHCAEFPTVSAEHMLALRSATLPPSPPKIDLLLGWELEVLQALRWQGLHCGMAENHTFLIPSSGTGCIICRLWGWGAWEGVTQLRKCLLFKHEDLSWESQFPHQTKPNQKSAG